MNYQMKSETSLYEKIKNTIIEQIENGYLKPGDRILTEVQLQKEFQVSRITVRKAISDLVEQDYLVKIQGKGTFVKNSDYHPMQLFSLSDLCQLQKKKLTSEVLSCQMISTHPKYSQLLQDDKVIEIIRLRKVNGVPIMIETTYFSSQYSFLLTANLSQSLYKILKEHLIYPHHKGINEVSIHQLDPQQAKLFNVHEQMSVIHHIGTVYNQENVLIHAVEEFVRVDLPDLFKYYL